MRVNLNVTTQCGCLTRERGKFGLSVSISLECGRTGTAVICYKSDVSCCMAAGVRSCLAGYGYLLFTSGDPARDLELNGKVDSQEISILEVEWREPRRGV